MQPGRGRRPAARAPATPRRLASQRSAALRCWQAGWGRLGGSTAVSVQRQAPP